MEVESLKDYLIDNKSSLQASILQGKYLPNPVFRGSIPKDNGQKQLLKPLPCFTSLNLAITAMGLDLSVMLTKPYKSVEIIIHQATIMQLI